MFSKKPHRIALITAYSESHPNEMHVIGHHDISWTEETFAKASMQEQFAKTCVKQVVQPSLSPSFECQGPVNNGEPTIEVRGQPRQMVPFGSLNRENEPHSLDREFEMDLRQGKKWRLSTEEPLLRG